MNTDEYGLRNDSLAILTKEGAAISLVRFQCSFICADPVVKTK